MAAITYSGIKIVAVGIALLVCVYCVVILTSSESQGTIVNYDFGDDGSVEIVQLGNTAVENHNEGKLQISCEGIILFESDNEYEVTDFDIGDVDNDGEVELVIGFWRYGDFGKKLNYQQVRRDPKRSFHLYIYKYSPANDNFYLVWGSSTLPHPIFDFEIVEKGDTNVLKVVEGSYEDYDSTGKITPVKTSYWIWNEWWFEEKQDMINLYELH